MQTSSPTPRTRAIIHSLLHLRQLRLTFGTRSGGLVAAAEVGRERRERARRPCPCGSGSAFHLCHGPMGVPPPTKQEPAVDLARLQDALYAHDVGDLGAPLEAP